MGYTVSLLPQSGLGGSFVSLKELLHILACGLDTKCLDQGKVCVCAKVETHTARATCGVKPALSARPDGAKEILSSTLAWFLIMYYNFK